MNFKGDESLFFQSRIYNQRRLGSSAPDRDLPGLVAMDTITELASGSSLHMLQLFCPNVHAHLHPHRNVLHVGKYKQKAAQE